MRGSEKKAKNLHFWSFRPKRAIFKKALGTFFSHLQALSNCKVSEKSNERFPRKSVTHARTYVRIRLLRPPTTSSRDQKVLRKCDRVADRQFVPYNFFGRFTNTTHMMKEDSRARPAKSTINIAVLALFTLCTLLRFYPCILST